MVRMHFLGYNLQDFLQRCFQDSLRSLVGAFCLTLTTLTMVHASAEAASAVTHCVQFDVGQSAAADELPLSDSVAPNATEKLIHIRLPISSLVRLGSEDSLVQYLYIVSGSSPGFQIVDYAPKTMLSSNVAGNVSIEKNHGNASNLGIKATAPSDFPVRSDASVSVNASSAESRRFETLPPMKLIAASGTMHRGMSAYFKLKPSTQTTLEGDKVFEITARVPVTWRAGLIYVNCSAYAEGRGLNKPTDEADLVCGQRRFVVGVYARDDADAKASVQKLAEMQHLLRSLASTHSNEIQDQRFPSLGHKLGAAFSLVKPKIPNHWLEQVFATDDLNSFERHLPRQLRQAADDYRQARKQVIGFAG